MSFQQHPILKNNLSKNNINDTPDLSRNSLLINSSFSIAKDQKLLSDEVTNEVLKKVSQTIVSLHTTLVPKTQNIEIYRDLSEEEQHLLKIVQESQLIHTILAGTLAIDSCLKYISKEETYVISSLMKGVTICLGNYKKMQEQFLSCMNGKVSQNFLKFFDSLKLIVSDIHKIPAAKIKKNQIEKHNGVLNTSVVNNELLNTINREENLLFSLMAKENSSLRIKLNELEKELSQLQKQKVDLLKEIKNMDSERKKRESQNNLTQTGSQSGKGAQQELLIRELREEIIQKSSIIMKMNEQFVIQINKYQTIFKRLEEENKLLKKYNDLDTAYILQQLEYEVEMLREEKRNNNNVINQIMAQMNNITWNRNQVDYSNQGYGKDLKHRYDHRFQNIHMNDPRFYETNRSRCPSVSPSNKQQSIINRYFSPNYDFREKGRNLISQNIKGFNRRETNLRADDSPRFGNGPNQGFQNPRVSRMGVPKQAFGFQAMDSKRQFKEQLAPTGRSQTKLGGLTRPSINQGHLQINKLKKQMRRSKFLNQEMSYM